MCIASTTHIGRMIRVGLPDSGSSLDYDGVIIIDAGSAMEVVHRTLSKLCAVYANHHEPLSGIDDGHPGY